MVNSKYPSDWEKRRRKVFQRDNWTCQFCGSVPAAKSTVSFHCHHIKPLSKGGGHSYDNLTTVCEDCHYEIHSTDAVKSEFQLDPVMAVSCSYCNETMAVDEKVCGSFCSERCYCKKKLEKFKKHIEGQGRVCPACFKTVEKGESQCDNCGNYNLYKDEYEPEPDDLCLDEALMQMIWWHKFH